MASPFDRRLATILERAVTSVLAPEGFRKRGSVYRRQQRELTWLVDVQKSRWNSEEEARFTLNVGIYVPGVASTYANRTEPGTPTLTDCVVYTRIGYLTPEGLDRWWKLRADDDPSAADHQTEADIAGCLERHALPFLRSLRTHRDVTECLEHPRERPRLLWPPNSILRLAYLGIVYHLAGDPEKCCAALAEATAEAAKSPGREHIAALARRLCPR